MNPETDSEEPLPVDTALNERVMLTYAETQDCKCWGGEWSHSYSSHLEGWRH